MRLVQLWQDSPTPHQNLTSPCDYLTHTVGEVSREEPPPPNPCLSSARPTTICRFCPDSILQRLPLQPYKLGWPQCADLRGPQELLSHSRQKSHIFPGAAAQHLPHVRARRIHISPCPLFRVCASPRSKVWPGIPRGVLLSVCHQLRRGYAALDSYL